MCVLFNSLAFIRFTRLNPAGDLISLSLRSPRHRIGCVSYDYPRDIHCVDESRNIDQYSAVLGKVAAVGRTIVLLSCSFFPNSEDMDCIPGHVDHCVANKKRGHHADDIDLASVHPGIQHVQSGNWKFL